MIIPDGSVYAAWNLVEVARYIENLSRVVRLQKKLSDGTREPIFLEWGSEVENYSKRYDDLGIYTSVYRFNEYAKKDLTNANRIASLYFDFDAEDVSIAFRDAKKLLDCLLRDLPAEDVRLYFTGSKGFHIEVEAITLGISPTVGLHEVFRFIATNLAQRLELKTVDFAVYDSRRMWRLPGTIHQSTGLYKTELPHQALNTNVNKIFEFAKEFIPHTPETPKFNVRANQWYKDWIAEYEQNLIDQEEEAAKRRRELFDKYGTSLAGAPSESFIRGAWHSALNKIREEAELKAKYPNRSYSRNKTLSRQAYRLFLLHLEANKPLEDVTNALQDVGVGIGLTKRETEATLKSAERGAIKYFEQNSEPKQWSKV